jgi:hypothetical protein
MSGVDLVVLWPGAKLECDLSYFSEEGKATSECPSGCDTLPTTLPPMFCSTCIQEDHETGLSAMPEFEAEDVRKGRPTQDPHHTTRLQHHMMRLQHQMMKLQHHMMKLQHPPVMHPRQGRS